MATASKTRSKGSIKESAVTKDKDKKGRESQRSKRQTSAKTKAKGLDRSRSPLHVSTTSDCTEQDQHQANLELKRNQRQGKTRRHTLQGHIAECFALLLLLLIVCVFVHIFAA